MVMVTTNVLLLFAVPTDTDIVSRSVSLPRVLPCSLALVFSPLLLLCSRFRRPAESSMLVLCALGLPTPVAVSTGAYWRRNKLDWINLSRAGILDGGG